MATRRRTKWFAAIAITLATVIAIGIAGELVARSQLSHRVSELEGILPGVSLALSGGPALAQLASGRIDVELVVSKAALNSYASCRTNADLSVTAGEGGLIVTTHLTVRGMTLPVDVTLVPRQDGDRWLLVADTVSAAGIALPADRALTAAAGRDGAGSTLAQRLLDGVPLPSDERLTITSVRFADGAAHVGASTSIQGTDGAGDAGLSGLRACLTSQEG